jgi:hypothetical protein
MDFNVLQAGLVALLAILLLQTKPLGFHIHHAHDVSNSVVGALASNTKSCDCTNVTAKGKRKARKFYMEDMREYFAMEPIDITIDAPALKDILGTLLYK